MFEKAIQKQNLKSFDNIIAYSNLFGSNFTPPFKPPEDITFNGDQGTLGIKLISTNFIN